MNKIEEAKLILQKLGMPAAQSNEISSLTFLALCGIKNNSKWKDARRKSLTITKGIMTFVSKNYNKDYAPNTRETFRRQVLHQFVQGRIVDYNPDNPDLPTNSPKAHYTISVEVLKVTKVFGSNRFEGEVLNFIKKQGSLLEVYARNKNKKKVPVTLPDGKKVELSPGKHNKLQALIISDFAARFIKEPIVLYIGDTAKKDLHIAYDYFKEFNINISEHDKLPDVVIFDKGNSWLFLIEAVTTHGPMNPKRVFELQELFSKCPYGLVFVSAFLNFTDFKKYSKDIAWETEVWLADFPMHMIHYNGDKFIGPRSK
jgi:type II restriction enzyme